MLGKSGAEVGASVTEEQMQKLASLGVALDLASREMLNNKTATAPVHVSSAFDSGICTGHAGRRSRHVLPARFAQEAQRRFHPSWRPF